jgi:hypothetical protein
MNPIKQTSLSNLLGFTVGAGLSLLMLVLLMGCAGSPRWHDSSRHPTNAQIQAVLGRLDSYVYYPAFEIYHNTAKDQYVFRSGGAWVTQNDPPRDVDVDALLASPSVAMNFDDAPARHHQVVLVLYPRNWGRDESALASAR